MYVKSYREDKTKGWRSGRRPGDRLLWYIQPQLFKVFLSFYSDEIQSCGLSELNTSMSCCEFQLTTMSSSKLRCINCLALAYCPNMSRQTYHAISGSFWSLTLYDRNGQIGSSCYFQGEFFPTLDKQFALTKYLILRSVRSYIFLLVMQTLSHQH